MTLSDVREEHSIKAISKKTTISEENIEAIMADDFSHLSRAKAIGFISILEREYGLDLKALREKALAYYAEHTETEDSISLALPRIAEKKGRSKVFLFLMIALLAYASWYFFTQFDKRTLGDMIPFREDKSEVETKVKEIALVSPVSMKTTSDSTEEEALSISNALSNAQTDAAGVETDIVVASLDPNVVPKTANASEVFEEETSEKPTVVVSSVPQVLDSITLKPEKKLWFGLVNIETGKRDHFSISDKFEIDVKEKSWLVATSTASFSFVNAEETQEYNDAKEHYFKVSKEGVEHLSKTQYIAKGGYRKW